MSRYIAINEDDKMAVNGRPVSEETPEEAKKGIIRCAIVLCIFSIWD